MALGSRKEENRKELQDGEAQNRETRAKERDTGREQWQKS